MAEFALNNRTAPHRDLRTFQALAGTPDVVALRDDRARLAPSPRRAPYRSAIAMTSGVTLPHLDAGRRESVKAGVIAAASGVDPYRRQRRAEA